MTKAGVSVGIKIAYALLTALSGVVLARFLGAETLGQYSFLVALISILSLPAQAGVPTLVLRETARYVALERASDVWGLWSWALRRVLISASVIAVGMLLVRVCWPGVMGEYTRLQTGLAAVALLLLPLSALRGAALQGLQKVNVGQLPENLVRPVVFLAAIGVASVLFPAPRFGSLTIALLAFVASLGIAALVGGFWLWQYAPPRPASVGAPDREAAMSWSSSLLPLTLLASIGSAELNVLVVGFWLENAELGIYKVLQQMIIAAGLVPTAINAVFMPVFAREYVRCDPFALQRLVSRASASLVLALLPISLLLIIAGEAILRWAFGPQFEGGHVALTVLMVGQLVNVGSGPVLSILNVTGHERKALLATVLAALVLVVTAGPLISRWGVVGAAVAAAGAACVGNGVMVWFIRRTTGLNTLALNREIGGVLVEAVKYALRKVRA